ncbi:MAG TPA: 2,3,4,5-tetrahydropyridine-2,6-dicarboxylate N-succinyltransferase [Candidatus Fimivivens sp.]|nr:2,3,4,5-tetrahydropyridine-2,6-dicarboxylate N-succinyltransferase [Candidatus Fimivivens sp.]
MEKKNRVAESFTGDINANAELLRDYFELSGINRVPVVTLSIGAEEFQVGPGKYVSAALMLLLSELAERADTRIRSVIAYDCVCENAFPLTDEMIDIVEKCLTDVVCSDARKNPQTSHAFARALLGGKGKWAKIVTYDLSAIGHLFENLWIRKAAGDDADVSDPYVVEMADLVVRLLNDGVVRAAEKKGGKWVTKAFVKPAILTYLRNQQSVLFKGGYSNFFDKVPLKYAGYDESRFMREQIRLVPNAVIRYGAHIGSGCVIMSPAFINVGASVGSGTMVDSHALVGSCAQIGEKCHLSAGVQVGGVLEPPEADPVCIGDRVMVGAGCVLLSGAQIGDGCFLGKGVAISGNTVVYDAVTGKEYVGQVPLNSVVKMAALASKSFSSPKGHEFHPIVPVITKHVTEENKKQVLEDFLRES